VCREFLFNEKRENLTFFLAEETGLKGTQLNLNFFQHFKCFHNFFSLESILQPEKG